jgi:ABC-type ATPase involved in cell division
MDNTTTAFESDLMKHADSQIGQMRKQLEQLHQNLRTVRHGINNNVAVIMAMAELAQRNPAQSAKLAQLCLEKAPQISAAIAGFSELFDGTLSLQEEFESQAPSR